MNKILITGGGYIGTVLVNLALKKNLKLFRLIT